MSRIATIPFDSGSAPSEFPGATLLGGSFDSTVVRGGAFSLKTTAGGQGINVPFATINQGDSLFMRWYIWINTLPGSSQWITAIFPNGGLLQMTPTGAIELRDNNNTLVGSASSALSTSAWHRIEIQCTLSASGTAGTLEGRVNGTSYASQIGTATTGIGSMTSVQVGAPSGGAGAGTMFHDDLAINDSLSGDQNTWLGPLLDPVPTPHGMGRVIH